MKIDWNPSEETKSLAAYVNSLHKTLSYKQIAKKIGKHWTYVVALNKWHKEHNENSHN